MFGRAAGLSCDDYSWDEGLLAMQDRAGANQNAVVPLVLTANTRAEAEQEVNGRRLFTVLPPAFTAFHRGSAGPHNMDYPPTRWP